MTCGGGGVVETRKVREESERKVVSREMGISLQSVKLMITGKHEEVGIIIMWLVAGKAGKTVRGTG